MKLTDGKDIILESDEKIATYRNRMTGDIYYTSNLYNNKYIDGAEFLRVFPKPISPKVRRLNWIRKDQLEKITFI